jgi:ABC-type amino acid transport substrate-binding protein
MKKWMLSCLLFCFSYPLCAENPPLRVAVAAFSPPFVMRSADKHFYGFDISTIEYVCQKLERRCEYIPMAFENLLPALETQKADVAVGGIIMTLKRAQKVRFSTPYLVSKAQFIGTAKADIKPPFHLESLAGKRVGVLSDGAFERTIRFMTMKKPTLIPFKQDNEVIHALNSNKISLALLSLPKARYWRSNSAGLFKKFGDPFPVGFGFAIAVNPNQAELIKNIDIALLDYQESNAFKKNYNLYIKSNI